MTTALAAYTPPFSIRKAALPIWLQFPAEHPDEPAKPFEVIVIPNSRQTPSSRTDFLLGAQARVVLNDPLGAAWPEVLTATNSTLTWSNFPNKYGFKPVGYPVTDYITGYSSYCGMAADSGIISGRLANVLIGVGDSHWPDNSLRRFTYECDRPWWEVAIRGTNYKNWKVTFPFGDDGTKFPMCGWDFPTYKPPLLWWRFYRLIDHTLYQWSGSAWLVIPTVVFGSPMPPIGPKDSWARTTGPYNDSTMWKMYYSNGTAWVDTTSGGWNTSELDNIDPIARTDDYRLARHYDGSPRGGHAYTSYWVWQQDQLFVRRGSDTGYPIDAGIRDDTACGDLITRKWIGYPQDKPDAPLFPRLQDIGLTEGFPTCFTVQHNVTEDLWSLNNDSALVLRRATKKYELWWKDPAQLHWSSGCFTLAQPTAGPTAGKGYAIGRSGALWWWFYTEGADKSRHNITTVTGHTELLNSYAQNTSDPQFDGMLWCPDIQKSFYMRRVSSFPQPLITVELTSPTSIDIQPVPLVGAARFGLKDAGGGVLNNWHYSPRLRGVIYRIGDTEPMQFMLTA